MHYIYIRARNHISNIKTERLLNKSQKIDYFRILMNELEMNWIKLYIREKEQ